MNPEFSVGEIAWHTQWQCEVRIAGPLELFDSYVNRGKLINKPMQAYRVVRLDGGKPSIAGFHGAHPSYLQKQVGSWFDIALETGWVRPGARA